MIIRTPRASANWKLGPITALRQLPTCVPRKRSERWSTPRELGRVRQRGGLGRGASRRRCRPPGEHVARDERPDRQPGPDQLGGVPDHRQRERIDALEHRLADDELSASDEGGGQPEEGSESGRPRHLLLTWAGGRNHRSYNALRTRRIRPAGPSGDSVAELKGADLEPTRRTVI